MLRAGFLLAQIEVTYSYETSLGFNMTAQLYITNVKLEFSVLLETRVIRRKFRNIKLGPITKQFKRLHILTTYFLKAKGHTIFLYRRL
jgi:hypothetical protein